AISAALAVISAISYVTLIGTWYFTRSEPWRRARPKTTLDRIFLVVANIFLSAFIGGSLYVHFGGDNSRVALVLGLVAVGCLIVSIPLTLISQRKMRREAAPTSEEATVLDAKIRKLSRLGWVATLITPVLAVSALMAFESFNIAVVMAVLVVAVL